MVVMLMKMNETTDRNNKCVDSCETCEIKRLQDNYVLMQDAIEKAKERVMAKYNDYTRTWLEGKIPHSYNDPEYKVALFVLAGSPPRGYVLADYYSGIVIAFSFALDRLHTYHAYNQVRTHT